MLKKQFPWFVFVWCVAHRLELALKDSLSRTFFKEDAFYVCITCMKRAQRR